MSRLHPQQWGERQTIDLKSDWAVLTEEERRRKAEEVIAMIRDIWDEMIRPPALEYRAEEAPDEEPTNTGGIGS